MTATSCCTKNTSVKQSIKCKVCSNFQMQMYPLVEASGGQEQYYVRLSWHSGQSDVPHSAGIWWPRAVLHQVRSPLHFFAYFIFSSCRGGKSDIGIFLGDLSSWRLSNLCRFICNVVVVTVSFCYCCCSSIIVDPQYRSTTTTLHSNNKNIQNKKTEQFM